METEELFPVYFNEKEYFEKDCDDLFLAFYHDADMLNNSGGVYMGDGLCVYPDGSMDND